MSTNIEVRPVRTAAERRIFLLFPRRVYRGDPLWVPPLLPELKARLNPRKSLFFQRGGIAECYIAWHNGQPVGTILAGEDRVTNELRKSHDCMFGFFECVEEYPVAKALLDRATAWGRSRCLKTLYGPFNLDYEDSYGFLIEGRDRQPALLCAQTPRYYAEFAELYGLRAARGDVLAYMITETSSVDWQQLRQLATRIRQRGGITIRNARFEYLEKEIDNVFSLLNRATAHLTDFIPWQRSQLAALMSSFRKVADPELVLFAEIGGQVVGFLPALPNLNEAFKHVSGLRFPWNYVQLAWYLRRKPKSLTIKNMLVQPEYWNRGVAILLLDEIARRVENRGIEWVDLSLTGADNPGTSRLAARMGAKIYKRYRVYRGSLNESD